jgi:hypothetical protein
MSSSLGQAAFRLGVFIVLVAGGLLLFEEPGTAEHAITQITLLIGLAFLAVVIALVRFGRRS